jgi:hypothetical protein
MNTLILENFRCFQDYHEIELKPLTLLVGENSSGKSSFLAGIKLAYQIPQYGTDLDFNEEPFQLGAFDQIANFRGGSSGRAKSFTIGLQSGPETKGGRTGVVVTFRKSGSQPAPASWSLSIPSYKIRGDFKEDALIWEMSVEEGTAKDEIRWEAKSGGGPSFPFKAILNLIIATAVDSRGGQRGGSMLSSDRILDLRRRFNRSFVQTRRPVRALAPIRSRPQRTYNPMRDVPEPTGGHVPMVLARLRAGDPERWAKLMDDLSEFGHGSGLFQKFDIKRLGRGESDPFQVIFKTSGPASNLIDVGYGVSQTLPLLVDILLETEGTLFLVQQPEVHLHPRAQAEIGSYLGKTIKKLNHRFVVETHSDYLIDRVIMDIRDGVSLEPNDVSILYFEKTGAITTIHNLSVDKNGNRRGAPPGYRSFFLQEEKRFLGGV